MKKILIFLLISILSFNQNTMAYEMTEKLDSYSIEQFNCLLDAVNGEVRSLPLDIRKKYLWFFEGQNQQNKYKNWNYCKEWNKPGRYGSNNNSVKRQVIEEQKIMIKSFKETKNIVKQFVLGKLEPEFNDYRIMKMQFAFSEEDVLIDVKNRKDMREVRNYTVDYEINRGLIFVKVCNPRETKCSKTNLYKKMVNELNKLKGLKPAYKI